MIQTLDGVLAGVQRPVLFAKGFSAGSVAGRAWSFWGTSGNPPIGVLSTALDGVVLSSSGGPVTGALAHVDPITGNAYLGRLEAQCSIPATLLLCDRLWHNGGYNITINTAQSSTTPAWPARDVAGSANGDGVLLGLEISAATGAGTPTITVNYTNEQGTINRIGTNIDATTASSIAGSFYRLSLDAGDRGVRAVGNLTLSATWTSGTMNLVAYRVLAALELPSVNVPNAIDALTAAMPQLFNGVVPFFIIIPGLSAQSQIAGAYIETQG